ncbi:MAG: hypothetical protein ACI37S_06785 [Candidatus Gastranaerophilaceae bacterium]
MKVLEKITKGNSSLFIFFLVIISSLFTIFYMLLTGNANEVYKDFVLDSIARVSSNKSAEMFLIYFLSFFGIIGYSVYYYFVKFKQNIKTNVAEQINIPKSILCIIGGITAYQSLVLFKFSPIIIALLVYALLLYIKDKFNMLNGIIYFFINLYTVFAIYRILVFTGTSLSLNLIFAVSIAFILSLVPILLKDNIESVTSKIVLIEQLFIPGLLLINLANKYLYNGKIVELEIFPQIKIFTFLIVGVFIIEAIYLIKKYWGIESSLNKIISFGLCASILGFNLFAYPASIVPFDMHHPYENIIGYYQIFQFGQIPFAEYVPISGLYSILHGAIFQIFGNGLISQFSITDNIYYFLVSLIILAALQGLASRKFLILFSVLFTIPFYDRYLFVLPIMLILSLPKLINNRNLWMKVWILTSLFHGLYYPLFGAAVCLSFLPLAIYQGFSYIKSFEFKNDIKTFRFWLNWILCSIPIILSLPLLFGFYFHIKSMSEQTVWADGIARFAQEYGTSIMPYLSDNVFYKQIIIYCIAFIAPALFIWVGFALALKLFDFVKDKSVLSENIKKGCLALSLVIMPLVSYSYTTVRLDIGDLFARSKGVLLAGATILIIYAINYIKSDKLKLKIICFALCFPMFSSLWGFLNAESKLNSSCWISPDYIKINNDSQYKIGTGFISPDVLTAIKAEKTFNKTDNYFAKKYFRDYYVHDLRGVSVLEPQTIKGYDAVKSTVENLQRNHAIIPLDYTTDFCYYIYLPLYNYYLHYWIFASGNYVWQKENSVFIPNDGKYSKEKVQNINNTIDLSDADGMDIGEISSSLGLSMDTLIKIFTRPDFAVNNEVQNNILNINFNKVINGNDADFVYVEFNDINKEYKLATIDMSGYRIIPKKYKVAKYFLKKVYNPDMKIKLEWKDNESKLHYMYANMGQGKLLIPLGAGNKWILNNHSQLKISVLKDEKQIAVPEVKKIEFLKLREVK